MWQPSHHLLWELYDNNAQVQVEEVEEVEKVEEEEVDLVVEVETEVEVVETEVEVVETEVADLGAVAMEVEDLAE